MLGVLGWVGSFDVVEAGLYEILVLLQQVSSHKYHKVLWKGGYKINVA